MQLFVLRCVLLLVEHASTAIPWMNGRREDEETPTGLASPALVPGRMQRRVPGGAHRHGGAAVTHPPVSCALRGRCGCSPPSPGPRSSARCSVICSGRPTRYRLPQPVRARQHATGSLQPSDRAWTQKRRARSGGRSHPATRWQSRLPSATSSHPPLPVPRLSPRTPLKRYPTPS